MCGCVHVCICNCIDMIFILLYYFFPITVVGGLLSAHLLSPHGRIPLPPGWPCEGPLLNMAESLARRLLPAFNTPTGLPYGTVNLRYGVPPMETTVTCVACCSSFILEFGTLTRLTG